LLNAIKYAEETEKKREKALQKRRNRNALEKIKTKKLGSVPHHDLDIHVELPENLPNSLREVSGKFNQFEHYFNRIKKRNMIEPRRVRPISLSRFEPKKYETWDQKRFLAEETAKYSSRG